MHSHGAAHTLPAGLPLCSDLILKRGSVIIEGFISYGLEIIVIRIFISMDGLESGFTRGLQIIV